LELRVIEPPCQLLQDAAGGEDEGELVVGHLDCRAVFQRVEFAAAAGELSVKR